MVMATAMDQEDCRSLDHSGKPSTQWALIPAPNLGSLPLGRGGPKGTPTLPLGTWEVLRGVGSTEKGGRPICLFA